MILLEESIEVSASPESAFNYVADFSSTQEWDPGVARASRVGSGQIGVGTEFDVVTVFRGREMPMRYRLIEYDPPSCVVLAGSGKTIAGTDTISFEPLENGGTRVNYLAELEPKGPLKLAAPFMGKTFEGIGKRAVAGLQSALNAGTH